MWPKEYRDYPIDSPLIKDKREPNQGIIGCEMHEINGWGNSLHIPERKSKKGLIAFFLDWIGRFSQEKNRL